MHRRDEDGILLPTACWRPGLGYRMNSSGVLGGGIGLRERLTANALAQAGIAWPYISDSERSFDRELSR